MGGHPPLIAGRIHGIRGWELTWSRGDAELTGHAGTRWAAGGEPTRALCLGGSRGKAGEAPHRGCRCGLYALHPWKSALAHGFLWDLEIGDLTDSAVGIVEAWGRIEVHGDGFRAQFARPIALVLASVPSTSDVGRARRRLADRYRAELIEVEDGEELVALCRERGYGLSRSVVDSLLAGGGDEEPPEPPIGPDGCRPRPPAPPGGARAARRRSLLEQLGDVLGTALMVVLGIAWYGFWAVVAVMIAIGVIGGDFGSSGAPSFTEGRLRIADQALVRNGDRLRYVAIVRNPSDERTAVAAYARGSVRGPGGERVARLGRRGRFEDRPTLLPGETGVLTDVLARRQTRALPDEPSFRTEAVARFEPARRGARAPVVYGEPTLDRARCRIVAPLASRGEGAGGTGLSIVARDAAGEISAAGTVGVGARAARRGRRVVSAGGPGNCQGWLRAVEVYPYLLPEHARRGRSG